MNRMLRKCYVMLLAATMTAVLAACGGGGGGSGPSVTTPPVSNDPCSATGQKQFVLDQMRDWYLWNNLLPAQVDIADYNTADDLLAFLTSFQPLDSFSFIGSAAADQAFFGEGQFEGFGFSSRLNSSDDWRVTRVFVDSPAYRGGLRRGFRILQLNGRTIAQIQAAEGLNAVLDTPTLTFLFEDRAGVVQPAVNITQDIVTIDPVPQFRIITEGGRNVGYVELATFISTANAQLDQAFDSFRQANVNDVILDLRYNGGGLVSTAELLGDLLGGFVADNFVFSETQFNADRAADNNSTEFFELRGASVNLVRLVVVARGGTASASELVINSMESHVDVTIVGTNTFGKPVGQVGFEFCDNILRPTAFQTVNADGNGDYFGGLPVDCAAADDLSVDVGDLQDPNIVAALSYLDTGACPVTTVPPEVSKPTDGQQPGKQDRRGPPHREFLDAY